MAIKSVKKESAKSRIKDNGHYFLATPGTHPSKILDLQESHIINRHNHRNLVIHATAWSTQVPGTDAPPFRVTISM